MNAMLRRLALALAVCALGAPALAQVYGTAAYLANGLSTTVKTIKGVNGGLSWYSCWNPNSTIAYVQVFDVASATSVTLGATVPKLSLPIAPTSTVNGDATVAFLAGIKAAATTTATGSSAPSTALDCNFGFQ